VFRPSGRLMAPLGKILRIGVDPYYFLHVLDHSDSRSEIPKKYTFSLITTI
jgi:hypothetical protein